MHSITILFFIILIITLPVLFLKESAPIKLIIWWYMFGFVISYIEAHMFVNQNYMAEIKEEFDKGKSWYEREYSLKDVLGKNFFVHGFLEYVYHSKDTRYTETFREDYVTWLEFLNAIVSTVFGILIIFGLLISSSDISYRQIGIMILIVSGIQIYGTILYFASYYTKVYLKLKKTDYNKTKLLIHLVGLNIIWIIFPIIVSVYGYQMIKTNKIISK